MIMMGGSAGCAPITIQKSPPEKFWGAFLDLASAPAGSGAVEEAEGAQGQIAGLKQQKAVEGIGKLGVYVEAQKASILL